MVVDKQFHDHGILLKVVEIGLNGGGQAKSQRHCKGPRLTLCKYTKPKWSLTVWTGSCFPQSSLSVFFCYFQTFACSGI
jgi:hypothetical protein